MRDYRLCLFALLAALLSQAVPAKAAEELVGLIKQAEKSVVRINTDKSLGSGVVVSEDGLVVTNFHVIENAKSLEIVSRDGQKQDCLGYLLVDPGRDLAVLRLENPNVGTPLNLAATTPEVGTRVAAFGNPRGLSFTASEGIVSAVRSGQELREDWPDLHKTMGYSLDVTWIQTTAAISGGNSGGPLVDMAGNLVGINTWGNNSGQQLNFAVSVQDVRRILARVKPTTPIRGFETLPKRKVDQVPILVLLPSQLAPYRLELPTGRVFSFEVFATDVAKLRSIAREVPGHSMVVITHPNGAQFASASQANGVLNGVALASWDNREPMVEVSYLDGRRHGVLKTWNEAGEPLVYSQYQNGRRHGFTVFFHEGLPQMIGQYANDRLEYLQLMSLLTPLEGYASEDEALKNPEAKALLERLEQVDAQLKKNEFQFRRQVKAFEAERRRDLAAKLAPEKRARSLQRARERNEQNEAFLREMRRRTHGL